MVIAVGALSLQGNDAHIFGIIEEALRAGSSRSAGWRITLPQRPDQPWISLRKERTVPPRQGWKLHVSAIVPDAGAVLRHVLPRLLSQNAAFKVAASLQAVDSLNRGTSGPTQVGKFITIYPNDDAEAVNLAVILDAAKSGLRGPRVPSDRPLRPGSLIHYRYGSFTDQVMQTPLGEILPAMTSPSGELVPDRRRIWYEQPEWAVDPFVAAGAAQPPEPSPLVAQRYLVIATTHRSFRGAVHIAVDIVEQRPCVLKQAYRYAAVDQAGRDARDRLRHEADVLARLASDPRFPSAWGLVENDGDLYLALEHCDGETIEEHVHRVSSIGKPVPGELVAAWGRQLAAMLASIHAQGFVYRDLKTPNVIVGPDGGLHLIDFEMAYALQSGDSWRPAGTRGYVSPQQNAGERPAITDDVYGLGAILYFAATTAEPSHAPRPFALLDRPIELLNPAISANLAHVIGRCLAPNPADRFASMDAVGAALAAVAVQASAAPPTFGGERISRPEELRRADARAAARRIAESICAEAERTPDGSGLTWTTRHPAGAGIRSRDVNAGSGGTMLALAELAAEFGDRQHRQVLTAGVHWLAEAPRPDGRLLPGLYVGEAGVGAALLRAGQALGDRTLIASAADRGRMIAAEPHRSPDLFNGAAGRLRFHLLLTDETDDPTQPQAAIAAGESILMMAEAAGAGGLRWTIPAGYDGLSGSAYLGYAHGAAGIGDALLDLFEATGDERFLEAARGAGRWLASLALPALEDRSGLEWPVTEGGPFASGFWCHGAAGIGRFFSHAATHDLLPGCADVLARAARTVSRGTRHAGPTQCHGLAGSIEFLLDAFQATGDPVYLAESWSLARLLMAFEVEHDGRRVYPSDFPLTYSPDYQVGYAGVAVCLLRLAEPEHRPHQLSRRGFRFQPRTAANISSPPHDLTLATWAQGLASRVCRAEAASPPAVASASRGGDAMD